MYYKRQISNSDNMLYSRDVEKRLEELEDEKSDLESALSELKEELEGETDEEEHKDIKAQIESAEKELEEWGDDEYKALKAFWDDIEGYVSEGETLIRDSHFADYAREYCNDVFGMSEIPDLLQNNINWEGVAEDLQADYSSAEWDGITYWFSAH